MAPSRSLVRSRLDALAHWPGSTRPLALVRIGLVLATWSRWSGDLAPWAPPVAPPWLGASFFASTSLLLAGFRTLAAWWTAATMLGIVYGLGVYGPVASYRHHHTYLMAVSFLWLALTPCGRSYSVDRWLALRRAERRGEPPPPERANLWAQRILMMQVSAVYFWSAWDKTTRWPFVSGAQLEAIAAAGYFGSDVPDWPLLPVVAAVLAVATVGLEYALAVGLWIPRLRAPLLVAALAFHGILYLAVPVLTFTVTMWLLLLLFVPPDQVHGVLDRLSGWPAPARTDPGRA